MAETAVRCARVPCSLRRGAAVGTITATLSGTRFRGCGGRGWRRLQRLPPLTKRGAPISICRTSGRCREGWLHPMWLSSLRDLPTQLGQTACGAGACPGEPSRLETATPASCPAGSPTIGRRHIT
eukprot:scaffold3581_cov417-Prasinococcus_capsulatus_cf.AAC.1